MTRSSPRAASPPPAAPALLASPARSSCAGCRRPRGAAPAPRAVPPAVAAARRPAARRLDRRATADARGQSAQTGREPVALAVAGSRIAVLCARRRTLEVYDAATLQRVGRVPGRDRPRPAGERRRQPAVRHRPGRAGGARLPPAPAVRADPARRPARRPVGDRLRPRPRLAVDHAARDQPGGRVRRPARGPCRAGSTRACGRRWPSPSSPAACGSRAARSVKSSTCRGRGRPRPRARTAPPVASSQRPEVAAEVQRRRVVVGPVALAADRPEEHEQQQQRQPGGHADVVDRAGRAAAAPAGRAASRPAAARGRAARRRATSQSDDVLRAAGVAPPAAAPRRTAAAARGGPAGAAARRRSGRASGRAPERQRAHPLRVVHAGQRRDDDPRRVAVVERQVGAVDLAARAATRGRRSPRPTASPC